VVEQVNRRNFLCSLVATLGWPNGSFAAGEPISVIVHRQNPVSQADASELRLIFQTTKTAWSATGERVTPVNLPETNLVRQNFDRAVLGLEPDRVARYWIDRKIRGDARPPRTAPNAAAVTRAVASNPAMIGYVPVGDVGADVKVIAKIVNGKLQPI
jgi:ABC-type phosphate transport system substrate-binding protein